MIDSQTVIQILALREAGYSVGIISDKHNVSQSCVKQICKKYGAHKGASRSLFVEQAKKAIVNDAQLTEKIVLETSASILCELNLAKQIKTNASLLLEQIEENYHGMTVAIRSRSLAAISTAVSVAQTITHKALELTQASNQSDSDLPSLHINSFSDSEIEEIRMTASMTDLELAAYESQKGMSDSGAIE